MYDGTTVSPRVRWRRLLCHAILVLRAFLAVFLRTSSGGILLCTPDVSGWDALPSTGPLRPSVVRSTWDTHTRAILCTDYLYPPPQGQCRPLMSLFVAEAGFRRQYSVPCTMSEMRAASLASKSFGAVGFLIGIMRWPHIQTLLGTSASPSAIKRVPQGGSQGSDQISARYPFKKKLPLRILTP